MDPEVKATNVLICDDIRREANGKELLIGVYTGIVLFPKLPVQLNTFSIRIEFTTQLKTADDLTVELHGPEGNSLFSVRGSVDMVGHFNVQVLSLVCQNVLFEKEGEHTIYFGRKGVLEPVYSFPVHLFDTADAEMEKQRQD